MGNASSKKATFGLTSREKKIIRSTWKIVKRDLGRNGLVIFIMYNIFFRDYPHNLKYFPFKTYQVEELEHEPLLKLHSLRVMHELNFCVENMDKQETLLFALRQNALNHRKRAIHPSAYDELRLSFLKGLAHQLGPHKFRPEADMAWDKALRVIFQVITDINDERKCICPLPNRPPVGTTGTGTSPPGSQDPAAGTSARRAA